jgi:monolysocardiolipin acyltransferase
MPPDQSPEQPAAPSGLWRASSTVVIGAVGLLCGGFLRVLSRRESHGMDKFLELLDERADVEGRERGLITVSNHVSVYVRLPSPHIQH